MISKLTYELSTGIINPQYLGLIREIMPVDYEIERYSKCPEQISQITEFFLLSSYTIDNAELIECFCENEDLFLINFEHLSLDDRTMLYFFFCIESEDDTDVVFSIESHAIQRLWLNGKNGLFVWT